MASSVSSPIPASKDIFVLNEDVTLHVTLYPKENADTVILLHGGPGVPDPFTAIVLALTPKYSVINFEQRGSGKSNNPSRNYSIEGFISDIQAITKHFNLNQFHIFGHSWGGLYAQIYAECYPENIQSLFLCSPSSGTNTLWKTTEEEVLALNKQCATNWEFLKMGWFSLLGMIGSDVAYQRMFYLVMTLYHRGHSDIEVDREVLKAVKADPVNQTRPNIVKYKALEKVENPKFPIVIIYGDSDIYGQSKAEAALRYPTSKSYEIQNCGHIPWLHNPTRFGAIMDDFYSLGGSVKKVDPSNSTSN